MSKVLKFSELCYAMNINNDSKKCCVSDCKKPTQIGSPFCWYCVHQCCNKNCKEETMFGSIFCTGCVASGKMKII